MKLKGGMLYYTLFLMIISLSVVSLIILRGYLFRTVFIDNEKRHELDLNNNSALELYKEGVDLFSVSDSCNVDLYNDSISFVGMKKEKWGIYDIVLSSARWKNIISSSAGLYGSDLDRGENIALYLADQGIDVSLSGATFLKGTCYVPSGILRPASAEGYPFIYKKLSVGEVKSSSKKLPAMDPKVEKSILSLFINIDTTHSFSDLTASGKNKAENSFLSKSVTYFEKSSISTGETTLRGKIILASTGTINIQPTSEINDIVVLARKIVIKDGFRGSLQAFALESVDVGKNVRLIYPSTLAICQDKEKKIAGNNLYISIDENSDITGDVIVTTYDSSGSIIIGKNSSVSGQVYCSGSVDLSGNISGSVYCNSFRFSVGSSTYINHILNATIDFSKMPHRLSGIDAGGTNKTKSLIKWLN